MSMTLECYLFLLLPTRLFYDFEAVCKMNADFTIFVQESYWPKNMIVAGLLV